MSDPLGTYSFTPWLRHGIANRIASGTSMRATVDVSVDIEGVGKDGGNPSVTVNKPVELYGPGDIVGIDPAQISRVEPEHWVTNFEPNYLAAIEFYDEDFPWRYTPAAPDDRRLLPWLALIVLEEDVEFKEGSSVSGKPLGYVETLVGFADIFADAAEGWAWAHAHFNAEFSAEVVETNSDLAAEQAQQAIDRAPDSACSRLLCPRKLKPATSYHAFLIPAFESGRLAGLGVDPAPLFQDAANNLELTSSAWVEYGVAANRPEPANFPFYHRWYFRTSERGDFESLVRLLEPKVVDSRVGHRDMDVTVPAPNVTGIDDSELGGILRLGGALRAPFDTLDDDARDEFVKYEEWASPYPQPFQRQLAAFVNLSDSYQDSGTDANAADELSDAVNDESDPMITPPIYGRWHALTERLLTERDGSDVPNRSNWVHDLNLDPRWRTAAGFGTKVVQQNQEDYMEAAWDQIGDVLEANRRIRQAQLAKFAGMHLHTAHIAEAEKASPAKLLMLAAPMKARIVSNGVTVRQRMLDGPMGVALTSTAMRRAIRPGGRAARRLNLNTPQQVSTLVARANEGGISAAPPRVPPKELLTPDELAQTIDPDVPFEWLWSAFGNWVRRRPRQALLVLLAILVLIALLVGMGLLGIALSLGVIGGGGALWWYSRPIAARKAASDGLREDNLVPATIDDLPGASGFTLVPDADPRRDLPQVTVGLFESDNADAVRFKTALRDQYRLIDTSRRIGEPLKTAPIDLAGVARDIVTDIKPSATVPRWTLSGINIPARIREQTGEGFVEAMAYPEFDTPMYEPLVKAGTDLFVPNLHLVAPDSVTLLETNQKFIEAYMVGLNHEFARELMWREYVTDQRGSYFRQFWDVRKKIAEAEDKEAARERFKDIKPLHRWPAGNDLGDNDNREAGAEPEEELVLVIRGELLKKYPNTIISAQQAKWQTDDDGQPLKTKERILDDAVEPIEPLYEARVSPDIYFFGFDLTALEARGDDTVDDQPGWFFRIEEVPGDARFGFDVEREPDTEINVWNDLAWGDVVDAPADGKVIRVADIPSHNLVEPTGDLIEKHQQWDHDRHVNLDSDVSSAELAYISLQTPVLMAIHASELLPDQ